MWSGIVIILFGVACVGYAIYGWKQGEVRMGTKGLSPYTPNREDNPIAFHLGVLLYAGTGIWMMGYGVLILTGEIPPPPLN